MIRLNWKAIGILFVTLVVLGVGAVALYKFQRDRTTARFLADAKAADAKGQHEDALSSYDMYLARRPGDADAYLLRSKLLDTMYQNSQTDRGSALVSYEAVLGLRPEDAETRRRVVELLVNRRPEESVAESFQSMSKLEAESLLRHVQILKKSAGANAAPTENATLLEYQGLAQLRQEQIPAARESFQQAIRLDPSRIASATILASLLIDPSLEPNDPTEAGRIMDAMVAANEQVKDNPNLAAAYLERAVIRRLSKQPEWQDDLAQAQKRDPKNIAVLLWSGAVASEEGRLDDARTAFKAVIALQPKDPRAYQQLAGVELRANHADEAAAWLRKGLEALGNRPDPNLSWFLTTILADTGKSQEARTALNDYRSLRVNYDNAQVRLRQAAQSRFVDGIIALGEAKTPEESARVAALLAGIDVQALTIGDQGNMGGAYYRTLANAYLKSIDRNGPPDKAQQARNNAIAAYRKAISATPTSAQPVVELAQLLRSVPIDPTLDAQARQTANADREAAAIDLLDQALTRFPPQPEDAATRENLGIILAALIDLRIAEQNQLPVARRNWSNVDRLLARGREAAPTSRVLNQLAVRYYATRQRATEISELLRKQVADPANAKNADLWATLAQSYSVQGKPDEAIQALNEAAAQVGDKVVLRLARAAAERARGDLDAALAALINNIEAIPTDDRSRIWQEVAAIQVARPDYGAARTALQRWAALRPRLVEPYRDLFAIAIQLKDEPAARSALAEIEQRDGTDGFQTLCARFDLAKTFQTPQESKAAIEALLKAYPERLETHLAQGIFLEQQNDLPGAITAYKAALDITPSSQVASRLAALYAKTGKLDQLELLRQQIGVSPVMTQISVNALASAGEKDRAAELAAEMAQGNPDALNLQLWQANVLKALGDPEQAQQKLRDLIKANPKDLSPWASLLMLQVSQKQLEEAKATVEEMKKNVEVERPELLWTRCALLLGDAKAADQEIAAALSKFPDDPIVHKTAVQYYRQTGRSQLAESTLRAIHQRKPEARWAINQLAEMLAGSAATWAEALALVEPPPPAGQETSIDRLVRANVYAMGPSNTEKEKAITLLQQLVDDPSNGMTVQTRLLLAQLYHEQGRTVESLEQARQASLNSTNLPALNFYIRRALEIDRVADARQALERLEQSAPDGLATALFRARILQKENKPAEAVESLKKALATLSGAGNEVEPAALLETPPLLFELGDAAAGTSAIEQVTTLRPDLAWAMIPALVKIGRIDEAFALAEKTVGTEQVATATAMLLQAMLQRKIEGEALTRLDALLDAALKVNPKLANLLIGQAQIRHFQGRFEEEIAIYKDVLQKDPNRGDFLNNMAWTLSESLNKPDEALTYVDQALAKNPGHPSITDTKGVILTRLKDYDKAIAVLQAAAQDARLRLPAIYPVILYHLSRAYQGAGRDAESKQTLAQAIRLGFRVELLSLEEREDADAFLKQNAPAEPAKGS